MPDTKLIPATNLHRGMQTYVEVETNRFGTQLKPDVILFERWDDTQGFVHQGQYPHNAWKTKTGHIVVYPNGAHVWVDSK